MLLMEREAVEKAISGAVQWLRLGVEAIGAVIVGVGVLLALSLYLKAALKREHANFNAIRLVLARYLALALEFQLGADILSTAVAPTPTEIAKLGAIAVIRTGLNYFLGREIKEEQKEEQSIAPTPAPTPTAPI